MKMAACDLPVDFNRTATADNVRYFFNYRLDYYLRMSGANRSDLKSPALSLTGGGSPIGNTAEIKMTNIIEAEAVCQSVAKTIDNCSHRAKQPSYTILKECYLDGLKDFVVAQHVGFAKTRFQEIKREALCEFAERFIYWQERYHVDELIDLREK